MAFSGCLLKKASLHTVTVKASNHLLVVIDTSRENHYILCSLNVFQKINSSQRNLPFSQYVLINRETKLAAALLEESRSNMKYKHNFM
jgi:hypothetical protein